MARKFSQLKQSMSHDSRRRADARTEQMLRELPLHELRQARQLSQEELAQVLHVRQGSISKLERRTDMYLSTLRRFIEAMGGELDITARFPEGNVRVKLLEELAEGAGNAGNGDDRPTA